MFRRNGKKERTFAPFVRDSGRKTTETWTWSRQLLRKEMCPIAMKKKNGVARSVRIHMYIARGLHGGFRTR